MWKRKTFDSPMGWREGGRGAEGVRDCDVSVCFLSCAECHYQTTQHPPPSPTACHALFPLDQLNEAEQLNEEHSPPSLFTRMQSGSPAMSRRAWNYAINWSKFSISGGCQTWAMNPQNESPINTVCWHDRAYNWGSFIYHLLQIYYHI